MPAVRPLNRGMRAVLYATCGLFVVNGVQLLFLSGYTSTFFAWTLQPLAAATIGAAFFGLASVFAAFVCGHQHLSLNRGIAHFGLLYPTVSDGDRYHEARVGQARSGSGGLGERWDHR